MSHDATPDDRVLDLAHLARITAGDADLARELLLLFGQQCDRLVPVICGAAEPDERTLGAHTLVGSARAVGAWKVAALAAALEGVAGPDAAAAGDLDRAVAEARSAIARHLGPEATPSPLAKADGLA